jgi:arylsulfatase
MHTSRTVSLALLASLTCVIAAPASAQQPQPHILFILADNIGYGDIGAYGGGGASCAAGRHIDEASPEGGARHEH